MTILYEWVVEDVDQYGDIVDTSAWDTREEAIAFSNQRVPDHHWDIALVRNQGNDDEGLLDRQWAYLVDGKLPAEFDGGAKIPERLK